jgi:ABC-type multidrug transport system ATPase subunit/ABC-type multidrug transport system permease subunit
MTSSAQARSKAGVVPVPEGNAIRHGQSVTPVTIEADSVSYAVGIKGSAKKVILDKISATIRPGQMVALMGASGAGKTTLLNVLSGSIKYSSGSMRVNGHAHNLAGFKRLTAFIPQDDTLLDSLTAREVFHYTARLRMPALATKLEREQKIHWVMKKLSLLDHADTRIGNVAQKGMSGGQRKRVSIGLELLVDPSVLFVDEATSGLDSKMASDVLQILKGLASEGRTVISTIHQPSYLLFCLFDELVLLNAGKLVYHGTTARTFDYFTQELGVQMPRNENPADVYMRVLQPDLDDDVDKQSVTDFASIWQQHQHAYLPPLDSTLIPVLTGGLPSSSSSSSMSSHEVMGGTEASSHYSIKMKSECGSNGNGSSGISQWQQFVVLLERCLYDSVKDKHKFMQGLTMKLGVGILLGVVFIQQAGTTQASAFTTEGPLFFLCFASVMDTIFPTVMVFPQTRVLVVREYRNHYYQIGPYFSAQLVCNLLLNTLYAIFMAVPPYFLVGLQLEADKFFIFFGVLVVMSWIGVGLGIGVGSRCDSVDDAPKMIMPLLLPLMMFSGFLIPYNEIPVYFRWLYHFSFFQYGLNIFMVNQFDSIVFTDCGTGAPVAEASNATGICNVTQAATSLVQAGMDSCAPIMVRPGCFEHGKEYLAHRNIELDTINQNFGILMAFFVGTSLGAYVLFRHAVLKKAQMA